MFALLRQLNAGGTLGVTSTIVAVALSVMRIVVMWLWCVVGGNGVTQNIGIEVLLVILGYASLACVFVALYSRFSHHGKQALSYSNISSLFVGFAVAILLVLVASSVAPASFEHGRPTTLGTVVSVHVIILLLHTLLAGVSWWIVTVAIANKRQGTHTKIRVLTTIVLLLWLCTMIQEVGIVVAVIEVILLVVASVYVLILLRNPVWVQSFTVDKKIRLLWQACFALFASVVFCATMASEPTSMLVTSAELLMKGGATLPMHVGVLSIVAFVRLTIAIIAALPNAAVVDRKRDEVQSLAALTRQISQATTLESILNTVTVYASTVTKAHGAWCVLRNGSQTTITSPYLLPLTYIERMYHQLLAADVFVANGNEITVIDAMQDHQPLLAEQSIVQSAVIVPFNVPSKSKNTQGMLVVVSSVPFGFEAEDVRLLQAFADTLSVATEQEYLHKAAIEHERVQKEVDVAMHMQRALLPKEETSRQVNGITIPAAQVGGDYFDVFRFADGTTGVIIADVAGKGVAAGLYMATLKGVVLAHAEHSVGPGQLLQRINQTLLGVLERHVYVSMTCLNISHSNSRVTIARAGHTPILVLGSTTEVLTPPGMAVGIAKPAVFADSLTEVAIEIGATTCIVLCTDGATEQRNSRLEELGASALFQQLAQWYSQCNHPRPKDVVTQTLNIVRTHGQGVPPHDDVTIVAVVVDPKQLDQL
jgi:phosphoserine phosphatase RsbU/P